ncbi:MAG: DUF2304 domain-containing protein [Lachnospiraceae bacterium]|jgi:hypothetical protein|nr:DUF2304 domain-containing protein [Lachnospiraceae bacterium]MBO6154736.1 DUF2304 domain-containing protein [Lachnospiraceae bacterium]MBQ1604297.1 DUF2304 domain-containing protein [Lachnospiraceae bacterium]MBQ2088617.1 DUF2304 domain-containing protein [Lachnospiraceae bacterium]MBQ4300124.1 DUF2304 domain-containing protein [Lachnospiraceae bacterium]
MSGTVQQVVGILCIIAILYIGNLVRVKRLELKYALVWFAVGVMLLIFDLAPGIMEWLARLLGIALPINMLFFLGFGFVLIIILTQTVVISNLTRKTKRLTQEVALLHRRIDNIKTREEETKEIIASIQNPNVGVVNYIDSEEP